MAAPTNHAVAGSTLVYHPDPSVPAAYFEGTLLVLPSPNGIAYLGSLAIDLLIATEECGFHRTGFFSCPFIEALVAVNVYKNNACLHTAFEVYQNSARTITLLQLRSHVLAGFGIQFVSALMAWIEMQRFKSMVLATGLDQSRRSDVQLQTHPFRVYSPVISPSNIVKIESTNIKILEPYTNEFAVHKSHLPPGAGLTRFILDWISANHEFNVNFLALSWFTADGGIAIVCLTLDNYEIAHRLADYLALFVGLGTVGWNAPVSWDALV